jgi:hypothetical protein
MVDSLLAITLMLKNSLKDELLYLILILVLWALSDLVKNFKAFLLQARAKKTSKFEYTLDKHNKIGDILYELLYNTQADRVYLAQFHNGEITAAKMHMYKFSISHEVTSAGISREKDTIRNIQVQDHLAIMNKLVEDKIMLVNNTDTIQPSLSRALFQTLSVQSGIYISIQDRDNTSIGFLAVEYVATPKIVDTDITLLALIKKESNLLQLVLLD